MCRPCHGGAPWGREQGRDVRIRIYAHKRVTPTEKDMFLGKLRRGGRHDSIWAPSFTLRSVLSYCHASCLPSEMGGGGESRGWGNLDDARKRVKSEPLRVAWEEGLL